MEQLLCKGLAVSLKLNLHLLHDPAVLFLGIYPREMKANVHTHTCVGMYVEALFNWPQTGNKPHAHHQVNGTEELWGTHQAATEGRQQQKGANRSET